MADSIVYNGATYTGDTLRSVGMSKSASLAAAALAVNTLTAVVWTEDSAITAFLQNQPVVYNHDGSQAATGYIKSIVCVGPNLYQITAISTVGLLTQMSHAGGIYTGQTVQEIASDICGSLSLYIAPEFASVAVYGWLPYVSPNGEDGAKSGSARDNLMQLLFAIGANLRTDAQGQLRIENLSASPSASIDAGKVYASGFSVKDDAPVTQVTVLEHQFVAGAEVKTLWSGTTDGTERVIFPEPMHTLVGSGLTIVESGANYALVTGSGTLTGQAYVHTTMEVSEDVTTSVYAVIGYSKTITGPSCNSTKISSSSPFYIRIRDMAEEDLGWWYAEIPANTPVWVGSCSFTVVNGAVTSARARLCHGNDRDANYDEVDLLSSVPSGSVVWTRSVATPTTTTQESVRGDVQITTPNEIRITDTTLVATLNSNDVVQRLKAYYICRRSVSADAFFEFESPGDVVNIHNPLSGATLTACLAQCDMAPQPYAFRAQLHALVGFTPWQVQPMEDVSEILTGSGAWTVPEGVTFVTAILIGGGQGGAEGGDGDDTPEIPVSSENSKSSTATTNTVGLLKSNLPPVPGGAGGTGGAGGKILRTSMAVVAGNSILYACGSGGAGAVHGSGAAGSDGTSSTFGSASSEQGASLEGGYSDLISGNVYGARGTTGARGGNGVGYVDLALVYDDITVDGVTYTHGAQGDGDEASGGNWNEKAGYFEAEASGGLGGGAAIGANGGDGGDGVAAVGKYTFNYYSYATAWAGKPGNGADAAAPSAETVYGQGGTGGNGGGGAGNFAHPSYAMRRHGASATSQTVDPPIRALANGYGEGGAGSDGGAGAPGCIILYYRRPVET